MTVVKKVVIASMAAVAVAGIVIVFKTLDAAVKAFPLSTRPR